MDLLMPLLLGLGIGFIQGLLGAGGSLMAMPVMLYGLRYPFRVAVGGSLALVGIGILPALCLYWRERQVNGFSALLMGASGMLGAMLASRISHLVPQRWLFALLLLLMAFSALNMLGLSPFKRKAKPEKITGEEGTPLRKTPLILAGFLIGILAGLVGVGGGFLLVPALLFFGGLPPRQAIATSLVVIGVNTLAGAFSYLGILPVQDSGLQLLALGSLLGSLIGFWLGLRLRDHHLKTGFAVLLLGLIALMVMMPPVS